LAKKQLEAYTRHKAEKKPTRRPAEVKVFDRRSLDNPKGVIPSEDEIRGPLDGPHERSAVIRNLRSDVLAQMKARRQIDECQYAAGRHWEALWERAEIGGIKAMDTTKEPVDGGGETAEPLTDRQRKAVRDLRLADGDLGVRGAVLVRRVLGRRETIRYIASEFANGSKHDELYFGRLFRDCLDVLSISFGYADRRLTVTANRV
jgi:hypothetical protein